MTALAAASRRAARWRLLPHLVAFTVVVVWSGNASVLKVGLPHLAPPMFIAVRFALAGALVLALGRLRPSHRTERRPGWRAILICAVTGVTINQLAFSYGALLSTAVDISIVMGLAPVMVAGLLIAQRRRWLPLGQMAAVGLGFAGLALVVLEAGRGSGGSALGDAIGILAPLAWAVYMVAFHNESRSVSALSLTGWTMLVGGLLLLPIGAVMTVRDGSDWGPALLPLAYTTLLSSAFAFTAYSWVLPRLGVARTVLYTYFQPLIGALMGAAFLREPFRGGQVLGAVAILAAAYVAGVRRSDRQALVPPPPVPVSEERGEENAA